jgi:O-antigen/teichoic acid export membrane protein
VGQLRVQVVGALVMAVLNLALSILFVVRYGIIGAVLGTVISVLVAQVVPLTVVTRNVLNKFAQSSGEPYSQSVDAVDRGPN